MTDETALVTEAEIELAYALKEKGSVSARRLARNYLTLVEKIRATYPKPTATVDLATRLSEQAAWCYGTKKDENIAALLREAADTIERLREAGGRLRDAAARVHQDDPRSDYGRWVYPAIAAWDALHFDAGADAEVG